MSNTQVEPPPGLLRIANALGISRHAPFTLDQLAELAEEQTMDLAGAVAAKLMDATLRAETIETLTEVVSVTGNARRAKERARKLLNALEARAKAQAARGPTAVSGEPVGMPLLDPAYQGNGLHEVEPEFGEDHED